MPLLSKEDGRVVFVASGSGPDAFSGCSQAMQARVRGADTREVRDNTQLDYLLLHTSPPCDAYHLRSLTYTCLCACLGTCMPWCLLALLAGCL